jgi:hypothetical protein
MLGEDARSTFKAPSVEPAKKAANRCGTCDRLSPHGGFHPDHGTYVCAQCLLGEPLREKPKPKGLKQKPRKARPGGSGAWRRACLERNAAEHDGYPVDEVTGEPLLADWQCHHVLEASHLNAAGLAGSAFLLWHPDNGMCLNRRTHERHHSATARVPASALRDHHRAFAELLDNTQGTDAFSARLARDYPEAR